MIINILHKEFIILSLRKSSNQNRCKSKIYSGFNFVYIQKSIQITGESKSHTMVGIIGNQGVVDFFGGHLRVSGILRSQSEHKDRCLA